MVLNQRQRLPAAADWEPYQAKHIEIENIEHKTQNAHPNSRPDQTKIET